MIQLRSASDPDHRPLPINRSPTLTMNTSRLLMNVAAHRMARRADGCASLSRPRRNMGPLLTVGLFSRVGVSITFSRRQHGALELLHVSVGAVNDLLQRSRRAARESDLGCASVLVAGPQAQLSKIGLPGIPTFISSTPGAPVLGGNVGKAASFEMKISVRSPSPVPNAMSLTSFKGSPAARTWI